MVRDSVRWKPCALSVLEQCCADHGADHAARQFTRSRREAVSRGPRGAGGSVASSATAYYSLYGFNWDEGHAAAATAVNAM